jgi:dolichol-phosphate mannosyltransferase
LNLQVGVAHLRRVGVRFSEKGAISSLVAPQNLADALIDLVVFLGLVGLGGEIGLAKVISFGCAIAANYFLHLRVKRYAGLDLNLAGQWIAMSLLILFLRGGLLALLTTTWGWPPAVAIVPVVIVTAALASLGFKLSMSPEAWIIGHGTRWRAAAAGLVTCAFLLRLIYLGQAELLPEEAYYWNYARHLDTGYLDHPPMVAWLIWAGTSVFGDSEFGVRISALCCGMGASFYTYRFTRNLFGEASALVALVMMQILPFYFFAGMLMTPDAPLTLAWAATLYYLERAILGDRTDAWWRAGIWIGVGLVSKYTIGLLAASTLVFLLSDPQSRRELRRWQPYAAALLALAVFSPVIVWNAGHDWASFAFQTSRRLAEASHFSLHKLIAAMLVLLTPTGALTLAVIFFGRNLPTVKAKSAVDVARSWRFIRVSVLVPLSVFVLFSLRLDVKLDWTGALWIAAVPALACAVASWGQPLTTGARARIVAAWTPTMVTMILIYGAFLHFLVLGLPAFGYGKQMELVPVGWRDLARQISEVRNQMQTMSGAQPYVVGMDRYMIASELAFYAPNRMQAVKETTSVNLFGQNGLMYERWFPLPIEQDRSLLLVAWSLQDITGPDIEARLTYLEPPREGALTRDGKFIRRFYYRIGYGYRNGSAAQ